MARLMEGKVDGEAMMMAKSTEGADDGKVDGWQH